MQKVKNKIYEIMQTLEVEYVAIVDREFNELQIIEPAKYNYSSSCKIWKQLDYLIIFILNFVLKEFMIKLQKKIKIKRIII